MKIRQGRRHAPQSCYSPAATDQAQVNERGEFVWQGENPDWRLKVGLAEMLTGGVIMDVTTPEQAKIAEQAGAVAVMALERVPADIRSQGGIARMAAPEIIERIMQAVSIPVMAKVRIGHQAEAQLLQALAVDFIDESEVLTPADETHHINKQCFTIPFVCGCRDLEQALRRIVEGAALIRTKGEAGSGNIVQAVKHLRAIRQAIVTLATDPPQTLAETAMQWAVPLTLVQWVAQQGKLPVPQFAAGGIVTPADAALVRQLGAESVFVGSGIFKSADPVARARAIVLATTYYDDPVKLLEASYHLGEAMTGNDPQQWCRNQSVSREETVALSEEND